MNCTFQSRRRDPCGPAGRPPKRVPIIKPEPDNLPMNEFPDVVPNESTSISPINELTNGLKRSLPDGADNDKKKIKLADVSEDELEVLSNHDNGKDHIELLIQRVDEITESLEDTIGNRESDASNDISNNLNHETNLSLKTVNHNGNSDIDNKDCKEDSPDKNTLSVDECKGVDNKTTDTSNINNNCEFIENGDETEKSDKNKLVNNDITTSKGISDLNSSSSSENLVINENFDHENENEKENENEIEKVNENENVINDIPVTENISATVDDSTVTECNLNDSNTKISEIENIVNTKQNGIELSPVLESNVDNVIKNTEETKTVESHSCENDSEDNTEVDVKTNCNEDFEVIDSDTSSDISSSDIPDLPNNINDIINGVHQISEDSFPQLLKLFSQKKLTYEQFDSLCTQKIIELMTERSYWGKDRSELQLLKEREKHWRLKYCSLNRQFKEIKTIVNIHKQDLKTNEHAKPHIITRTVGLQAVLCPKKEGSMKLPKLVISPSKPDNNPVSIISDEEDNVNSLNAEESAKPSTSKIERLTPKKQTPSLNIKPKSPVVSPSKTVSAAKSLNSNDTSTPTIDLTGNDDAIDVSNVIDLEEPISPYKVLRRQSPGILPVQLNNNLPKTITYVELPTHSTSTSSYIMRTTSSGSPQRTVLNKDTIITNDPKAKLKPYLIDVSHIDPVLVQPCTVTYTTRHVPVSQISGTLQPMSTVPYTPRQITMSQLSGSLKPITPTAYTTCHLPVSRLSGSLSQATPGTTFTACRLPISIHAIPPLNSSEHCLMRSQSSRPPPPAIPILEHPAPVPGIPNQKSLPSWKKLPPAPKVSLSKTVESQIPQALVLSWNMTMNKTIAEVVNYQIYAYQEVPNQPPKVDLWKKIGDVNALPLPMACSLTQFSNGEKYHFAVRAVDIYTRVGPFSLPQSMYLR
ncbi:putative uncharacterized protein DDB_G0282499 isoform X4 [Melanaphis sacchari]|uniref:putative uncharacterized protein DDB_G0282499 isoform X4 n=1 Tax=Melanaphis sacchari TaxID=742174 RepID=UPI000DC149B1|nr:putative uncharacterized protein DDB_G0282499 isoform X4 [Melanaphis sacchari]